MTLRRDGYNEEVVSLVAQIFDALNLTVSEAHALIDYLNDQIRITVNPQDYTIIKENK